MFDIVVFGLYAQYGISKELHLVGAARLTFGESDRVRGCGGQKEQKESKERILEGQIRGPLSQKYLFDHVNRSDGALFMTMPTKGPLVTTPCSLLHCFFLL